MITLINAEHAQKALFVLGILYTCYFARSLILPIFIALLLAVILQPLVQKLNRLRIPNPVGAAVVMVTLLALVALAIFYVSQPAAKWLNQAPSIMGQVQTKLAKLKKPIEHAKETTDRLGKITDLGGGDGETKVAVKGPSLAGHVVSGLWFFLGQAAIVIILMYFFLAQGRGMLVRVTNGFRDPSQRASILTVLEQIQHDVSTYLQTYAIINAGIALVVTLLMLAFGMPTPILWGIMTGTFHFIPYLGPATALGIISLVSLLSFDSLLNILLPPLSYLALIILEGNLITPMIMSNRLAMNPIVVFVSILFWGWVWGVPGIFLAVPILATLKIIFNTMDTAPQPLREALK
jgi:predicted PurR-regulated permease PerM